MLDDCKSLYIPLKLKVFNRSILDDFYPKILLSVGELIADDPDKLQIKIKLYSHCGFDLEFNSFSSFDDSVRDYAPLLKCDISFNYPEKDNLYRYLSIGMWDNKLSVFYSDYSMIRREKVFEKVSNIIKSIPLLIKTDDNNISYLSSEDIQQPSDSTVHKVIVESSEAEKDFLTKGSNAERQFQKKQNIKTGIWAFGSAALGALLMYFLKQ